jgi:ABC-2 type transport system ATP-binding protein
MPSTPAIETHKLKKVFGDRVAVQGLDLVVQPAEVFGFLGPNGAGKTTSVKMLLGLTAPTSGSALLLGAPLGDRAILSRVGFLPEHFRFQEWLTAREFLELHGQLFGMPPRRLAVRIDELLGRVGLDEFRHKQLRTFSKGMLQRIGLAQALLNQPALVFLDEPTSGLDPVGRLLVRDMIRELRQQGTTVFLNSHLLSEVEVTCTRVAFIRHGEVVRVLELATLDTGQFSVTIRATHLSAETLAGLGRWGRDIVATEDQVTLTVPADSVLPEVTRYLVAQGADVFAITPKRMSLDELFVETVGKDGGL